MCVCLFLPVLLYLKFRHRAFSICCLSPPNSCNNWAWTSPKARSRNSIQVSCGSGRDTGISAIICCFKVYVTGSWNRAQSLDLDADQSLCQMPAAKMVFCFCIFLGKFSSFTPLEPNFYMLFAVSIFLYFLSERLLSWLTSLHLSWFLPFTFISGS